jgi:hypothetical protein
VFDRFAHSITSNNPGDRELNDHHWIRLRTFLAIVLEIDWLSGHLPTHCRLLDSADLCTCDKNTDVKIQVRVIAVGSVFFISHVYQHWKESSTQWNTYGQHSRTRNTSLEAILGRRSARDSILWSGMTCDMTLGSYLEMWYGFTSLCLYVIWW